MLKRVLISALAVLTLTACSSAPVEIDIAATTAEMLAATSVRGELIEMSGENVEELLYTAYDADTVAQYSVYSCASKATAEEIAIFKATSEDAVEDVGAILEQRVLDLRNEYENYIPIELEKLDSAIIVIEGLYVALIIADDTQAANEQFVGAFE